jgi:putative ABC transport system permease protein
MFDLDQWQEIISTLRRSLLRTTLTAIGVFWGVLMLMIMVGFGNGLEGGVRRDFAGLATNSIYVWGDKTSIPFGGMQPGKFVQLTRADAAALESIIPEIDAIAPRVQLGGRNGQDLVTRGDRSGPFNVSGDVPAYIRVQPCEITKGRFLNALDIERRRKVAVIGHGVEEVLFRGGEDPIGKSIQIKHTEFIVVGVFTTPAQGDRGERLANTIHTPLTTFQQSLRPEPWVNNFAVLVKPGADTEQVEKRVKDELARLHRFSPDDKEAVGVWNTEKEFSKITGLFTGISLLIWVVGSVTLAAGIIGVSNIMMISVRERTREIGIRRAIGATPFSIVTQILKESTLLTSLAGYLGLAAGVGALEAIGSLMKASSGPGSPSMFDPPTADFRVAMAATLVVIAGGALAGFFPALYAVRIRPVVALRDE